MGRFSEFHVTTGMEIVSPDNLMVDIAGLGNQIFEQSSHQPMRMWEGGAVITPKSSGLVCIDPNKLKYYHVSLIAERTGKIPLDFLTLARHLDPALATEDQIGSENLKESVAKTLFQAIGHCSLEGRTYSFDYLDVIDSAHYAGQKVFVLRQLDTSSDGSGDLDIITRISQNRVEEIQPRLSDRYHDLLKVTKIRMSVPIAHTKQNDPKILDEFKETFTENLLDPAIVLMAGALDISNKL